MFESVRAFFRSMQEDGYVIEIRSFEQVRGTNDERVGFTIRGMCVRNPAITGSKTQQLMIDDGS
jgi:hypothetical protein